jgi:hypothetical protein
MNAALPRPVRELGLLLALVALAIQLAAASVVPFAALSTASVDRLAAASICHDDQGHQPSPHHAPACAVCPLCQAIAHAGALLASPGTVLVAPILAAFRAFALPPARAPPAVATFATSARGPPVPL